MVVKNVVRDKQDQERDVQKDIKLAMDFLKQSNDLVKIEDILPFFPDQDFVTIDHFKDAICESLKEYSDKIEKLKEDMGQASKSAQTIRDEIVESKAEYHFVRWVPESNRFSYP